jgi:hypothetical protein
MAIVTRFDPFADPFADPFEDLVRRMFKPVRWERDAQATVTPRIQRMSPPAIVRCVAGSRATARLRRSRSSRVSTPPTSTHSSRRFAVRLGAILERRPPCGEWRRI